MAEKRKNYRRYEDRRVAVMLAVHEVLFDHPPGQERDKKILETICTDYLSDGAALVKRVQTGEGDFEVTAAFGNWIPNIGRSVSGSLGFETLGNLQKSAPGALTFTRVKRPAVFGLKDWDSFWGQSLFDTTMSLLSVHLLSKGEPIGFIWILQSNYSREWSSRDRALAEEIASLLSRAIDKGA